MHLFFQRKETDDEILYMFIHPYFFLLIIVGGLIPSFYIIFWIITIIKFVLLVFFVYFFIEYLRIIKDVRIAKKDNRVMKSGKYFSYYNPRTIIIFKDKQNREGTFKKND